VEYWLPAAEFSARIRLGLPVARERPFFDKFAGFPMEALFAPDLVRPVIVATREWCVRTRRLATDIGAGNELHKYILTIRQGRLIMGQQIAPILALFLADERIIRYAGQFTGCALPED
jgi:hypothetical protein